VLFLGVEKWVMGHLYSYIFKNKATIAGRSDVSKASPTTSGEKFPQLIINTPTTVAPFLIRKKEFGITWGY
jgi:hypothetical protein